VVVMEKAKAQIQSLEEAKAEKNSPHFHLLQNSGARPKAGRFFISDTPETVIKRKKGAPQTRGAHVSF